MEVADTLQPALEAARVAQVSTQGSMCPVCVGTAEEPEEDCATTDAAAAARTTRRDLWLNMVLVVVVMMVRGRRLGLRKKRAGESERAWR